MFIDSEFLPTTCPECHSMLEWTKDKDGKDGADLQCPNRKCGEVKRVESFIKDLGIDKVGESSLINFGIRTFTDLLSWSPDLKYRSQVDFTKQLSKKLFNASKVDIMRASNLDGVGTTIFDKILNISNGGDLESMNYMFTNGNYAKYLTEGIGERTLEKAEDDWNDAWAIMQKIVADVRYEEPIEVPKPVKVIAEGSKVAGKSFLFSGTMVKRRTDMEQLVDDMGGFVASSVNKNLQYLICGADQWGSSTKFQKATKLNIPILTESEFWDLVR